MKTAFLDGHTYYVIYWLRTLGRGVQDIQDKLNKGSLYDIHLLVLGIFGQGVQDKFDKSVDFEVGGEAIIWCKKKSKVTRLDSNFFNIRYQKINNVSLLPHFFLGMKFLNIVKVLVISSRERYRTRSKTNS